MNFKFFFGILMALTIEAGAECMNCNVVCKDLIGHPSSHLRCMRACDMEQHTGPCAIIPELLLQNGFPQTCEEVCIENGFGTFEYEMCVRDCKGRQF